MSRRNRTRRLKPRTRRWLSILAVILASVTICGFIVSISDGGENFFKPSEWVFREVNENNLYQTMTFANEDGKYADGADGVTVKLDDQNRIKVNGVAEKALKVQIGTITLNANTSYIFGGMEDGSNKTMYLSLNKEDGTEFAKCYNSATVVKPDTTVTLYLTLNIAEDHSASDVLEPIVCIGSDVEDIVNYYA